MNLYFIWFLTQDFSKKNIYLKKHNFVVVLRKLFSTDSYRKVVILKHDLYIYIYCKCGKLISNGSYRKIIIAMEW
jgi:hypothetical protein